MKWKTLTVPEASKEVQEMKDDIFSVADGLTEEDLAEIQMAIDAIRGEVNEVTETEPDKI